MVNKMLHGYRPATLSLFVLLRRRKKNPTAIANLSVLVMLGYCDTVIADADQTDGPPWSFSARLSSDQ